MALNTEPAIGNWAKMLHGLGFLDDYGVDLTEPVQERRCFTNIGKVLRVIDYIGNHRIFLTKLRALLTAGPSDRSRALKLDQIIDGTLPLPAGCSISFDLQVIEILRDLLRPKAASDDWEAQFRDFRPGHGTRPTAAEIGRMGFDPARNGHGGCFDVLRDMGDPVEPNVLTAHGTCCAKSSATQSREPLPCRPWSQV
jgi:hypothetical protein